MKDTSKAITSVSRLLQNLSATEKLDTAKDETQRKEVKHASKSHYLSVKTIVLIECQDHCIEKSERDEHS